MLLSRRTIHGWGHDHRVGVDWLQRDGAGQLLSPKDQRNGPRRRVSKLPPVDRVPADADALAEFGHLRYQDLRPRHARSVVAEHTPRRRHRRDDGQTASGLGLVTELVEVIDALDRREFADVGLYRPALLINVAGTGYQRVELDDITIIRGDNEVGKTTLMSAVEILLTYQASSSDRRVRAIVPRHVDALPGIRVEMTGGEYRFTSYKRYSTRAGADKTELS